MRHLSLRTHVIAVAAVALALSTFVRAERRGRISPFL